jgi:hypothetical protein
MTTITDPRAIAATLDMDTYQLAEQLVTWANDALPTISFEARDFRGPMPLEDFDAQVEKARRYLENAHEAFKAWMQDNPEDEPQS